MGDGGGGTNIVERTSSARLLSKPPVHAGEGRRVAVSSLSCWSLTPGSLERNEGGIGSRGLLTVGTHDVHSEVVSDEVYDCWMSVRDRGNCEGASEDEDGLVRACQIVHGSSSMDFIYLEIVYCVYPTYSEEASHLEAPGATPLIESR